MAKKNFEGRQDEIEALKGIEGIDPASIMQQVTGFTSDPPPITPPPVVPPAVTTPAATPPATPPKLGEAGPPADATGILKEIFGDQFTSVDDLKKKNIPEVLKEVATLRQQNQALSAEKQELSGKLNIKPRNNFANDDVALFNEFVKTTGIKSFDVFNRLNSTELASMDYMNAIILARLLENPELAAKEPQLRKHVEKTYNVDPEQVSEEELEVNQIGLAQEGARAKAKLQEIKGKLKIPEPDQPAPVTTPLWTPEQTDQAKTVWDGANRAMGEKLSTIPYYLPNSKEPIITFAVPPETLKAVQDDAVTFAISNQMETNEKNLEIIARFMYSEIKSRNEALVNHAIFEKARSLTQEESLKYYHNPTPLGNGDKPPVGRGDVDDEESQRKKIFEAEIGRT